MPLPVNRSTKKSICLTKNVARTVVTGKRSTLFVLIFKPHKIKENIPIGASQHVNKASKVRGCFH